MLIAKSRFSRGLFARAGRAARCTRSGLRKAVEREFFYRGVPSLELKQVTLLPGERTAEVEFFAAPLHQMDSRLASKPWAQIFVEQVMTDSAKILRTVWTEAPDLESITLRVLRRLPHPRDRSTEENILILRARGAETRRTILQRTKSVPAAVLDCCEVSYQFDSRIGLRPLAAEPRTDDTPPTV